MRSKIGTVRRARNFLLFLLMLAFAAWSEAGSRNWQSGTLRKTERIKVYEGAIRTSTLDGYLNFSRNSYSPDNTSTSTTAEDYVRCQVFTIEAGEKTYVVREPLFYAWSRPALSTIGQPVAFAMEKGTFYIRDADGKEHKATILRVRLKRRASPQPGQPPTPS